MKHKMVARSQGDARTHLSMLSLRLCHCTDGDALSRAASPPWTRQQGGNGCSTFVCKWQLVALFFLSVFFLSDNTEHFKHEGLRENWRSNLQRRRHAGLVTADDVIPLSLFLTTWNPGRTWDGGGDDSRWRARKCKVRCSTRPSYLIGCSALKSREKARHAAERDGTRADTKYTSALTQINAPPPPP